MLACQCLWTAVLAKLQVLQCSAFWNCVVLCVSEESLNFICSSLLLCVVMDTSQEWSHVQPGIYLLLNMCTAILLARQRKAFSVHVRKGGGPVPESQAGNITCPGAPETVT